MSKSAVRVLIHEHRLIRKVVDKCSFLVKELRKGAPVDVSLLTQIVEFMQQYADKNHHGKEEDLLFPAFEKAGVPSTGCPLAALRYEHQEGRRLVSTLKKALLQKRPSQQNRDLITSTLTEIVELYPSHIWKEEFLLFPLAGRLFSRETREDLAKRFEMVEKKFGYEVYKAYEKFVKAL